MASQRIEQTSKYSERLTVNFILYLPLENGGAFMVNSGMFTKTLILCRRTLCVRTNKERAR